MSASRRSCLPRVALFVEALENRELPSSSPLLPVPPAGNSTGAAIDRVLVRFRDSLARLAGSPASGDFTGLPIGAGMRIGEALSLVNGLYEVKLTGIPLHQALTAFANNPLVAYAQPDFEIRAQAVPNDPSFANQWALRNTGQFNGTAGADIKATEAWNYTTGSGQIIVAVLDSGINYNHPDLAANMWRNPGESSGSQFQGSVYGWNFVNNSPNPMDDNGHGTHVAGIIGAVGNNGVGISGVAWNVQLMAVKILNYAGSGFTSDAIRGLNFAVSRGAKIANNSWGGAPYDPALANAINEARAQGVIVVAAAGNQGRNIDTTPFYPASYQFDNVVRVAATDNRDALANFSNFGVGTVQLAAPGVNIISTSRTGGYVSMSGTSMAAPMVSGALALVWDQNPSWNYQQVIQRVLSTVDSVPALATRVSTGGRLNLARALAGGSTGGGGGGTGGGSGSPSAAWVTSMTSVVNSSLLVGFRVTFSAPIQASTFTPEDVVSATGPQGNLTVTGISPVSGSTTQFDVNVAPQSVAGTYRLTIGPQILTLSGAPMDQNRNGIPGENPGDQFSGSVTLGTSGTTFHASGLPLNLPDVRSTTVTMSIGSSMVIQNLAVRLNVSHTWVGDLLITLRGPSGQTVTLINRRGGSGQNLTDTVFSDSASTSIASGVAPFNSIFRPESPLSVFNGTNVRGYWTLTISDQAAGNTGRLNSWSLIVNSTSGSASWSAEEEEKSTLEAAASKWSEHMLPAPAVDIVTVSNSQTKVKAAEQGTWLRSAPPGVPLVMAEGPTLRRPINAVIDQPLVIAEKRFDLYRSLSSVSHVWADKLSALHRLA